MKVAVASGDGESVSRHFGRAPLYAVFTLEQGEITGTEVRSKAGHETFASAEPSADTKHRAMVGAVEDCEAVLVGGIGDGAVRAMEAQGIQVILTDEPDAARAALRYARGDLPNLTERIHRGRGRH